MKNIEVKGHSGCDIQIVEKDNHLYVKKSTVDKKYLNRLELQGKKQAEDTCLNDIIINPKIYEIEKSEDACHILMDYIYAKNFVDYFEHASVYDINNFITNVIKYIDDEISQCEIQKVARKVFHDKFNSVCDNCRKNKIILNGYADVVQLLLHLCEDVFMNGPLYYELPVGKCHGDLTFSNILFTSNNFYFIDYLDSFVETPIQDIVKLRQDTKYLWSTMMYSKRYDRIRLKMIFEYIDKKINEYYNKNEYYVKNYYKLQLMNILRILPYVKEDKVCRFVINIIDSLLKTIKKR